MKDRSAEEERGGVTACAVLLLLVMVLFLNNFEDGEVSWEGESSVGAVTTVRSGGLVLNE